MTWIKRAALSILLLTLFISTAACRRLVEVKRTKIALGTFVQTTLVVKKTKQGKAQDILNDVFKRIGEYDTLFDYRKEKGTLFNFNNSTILKRKDEPILFDLLYQSQNIAKLTNGYFDPTILPLIKLWGFNSDKPHLPPKQAIEKVLPLIDYHKITVTKNMITKPISTKIDLSGIAKGKIVDLLRDYLLKSGYSNFLINAGGDLWVSGTTKDHKKWKIAIQDPLHHNQYSGILQESNVAVVTSGDYERYFEYRGVRYCHLLNPKTGYPNHTMKSVTIIARDTSFADALATAVFVMGPLDGFTFLNSHNIKGFIIYIDKNGRLEKKATEDFWK